MIALMRIAKGGVRPATRLPRCARNDKSHCARNDKERGVAGLLVTGRIRATGDSR